MPDRSVVLGVVLVLVLFVSLFASFLTTLFVPLHARLVWRFWANFGGARAETEHRIRGKNDPGGVVHPQHAASPVPRSRVPLWRCG